MTTPSFYAIRNTSFALSTLDGIRIDTHSRTIDANGELFWDPYVIGLRLDSYFAHGQAWEDSNPDGLSWTLVGARI